MRPLITFIFLSIYSCLSAQQILQNSLIELSQSPFYKHASLGICVRSINDQALLAEIAKDKLYIPASTLKLMTTLAAKFTLGDEYRFVTKLYHDGIIHEDGTLYGNVYVIGNGDPSFGGGRIPGNANLDEVTNKMVDFIRQTGILRIDGDIFSVVDSEIVSPIVDSWQWNDIGNYYATGIWPININENIYNIYFNRDKALGETATIAYTEPYVPALTHQSFVKIDSSHKSDNAYIFGSPHHYDRYILGSIPQGSGLYKIKGSLPDPPLFFAYKLYAALLKVGITAKNYNTTVRKDGELVFIGEHLSPTLKEIMKVTNEKSHNLYAEGLLHALGCHGTEACIEKLYTIISSLGIDKENLQIVDGSGLSTKNLISPDDLTTFLAKMANILPISDILDIIPKVGESGTVKNLLTESPAKGKMWIKSGSMENILCYAGFAQGLSGKYVSFAIFLNGSISKTTKENKIELEKILEAIYKFS